VLPQSWQSYRPPATDVVVAAGFVALGQAITWWRLDQPWAFAGPRWLNAVLSLLLMASLAWLRRAPLAAVCWAVATYYLPHVVVPHDLTLLGGFVPLVVLTASAGYFCPRRRALLAAAIAVTGITAVMLSTPWLRSPDSFAYNGVVLLAPWLGMRALREREDRAARLSAALVRERAAKDAAVREVAFEERARIARELHDIVAHSVSVMVVQVGAARMQLRTGAASAEGPLLAAEEVGRQALDDLRRLLGVLRAPDTEGGHGNGPNPPQPGLSELDALVAQVRAAGLLVDVAVEGDPAELPAGLDLTAYRVVQEALTNTLKHSGAAQVKVRLVFGPSSLVVDIVDDGVAAAPGVGAGHGLVGIRERVSLFGGTAIAGPGPAGGWQVRVELPLPAPSLEGQRTPAVPRP
jgi:signal transduction histidine kinase